jgi:4-amino-4-deoxy-L-arabinose transferase-like glycosyltransferase
VSHPRLVGLLALFLLVWFTGLESRKLIRPDEGRYAEIPREMAVTGDWLTPRLNGLVYFEKPPLQYWATAAAYLAFGKDEWTARLWSALTGLFGIAIVFGIARKLYGRDAAIAAAAIVASSLWYFAIAHINTLDMGLTCFMTLTLAGFLYAERSDASARERFGGMMIAWIGMALAVLSKGLIGIVLPAGVLFFYSLWQRDWRIWDRVHVGYGLLAFMAVAAPWFVLVSLENPEFGPFFFFHEHLDRFASTAHRREGAPWYFVPFLLGGLSPWTLIFVSRLRHVWIEARERRAFNPERLLIVWCVFIFVFFSVSGSKLPSYILPMFPGLALLMAPTVTQTSPRVHAWNLAAAFALAFLSVLAVVEIDRFATDEMPVQLFLDMRPWLTMVVAALLTGTALALHWRAKAATLKPVLVTALSGVIAWQAVALGYDELSPATSSYHLVRQIVATQGPFQPELPFFTVQTYEQTLPFYLDRTLTLVDFYDEMSLGLALEPKKGIEEKFQFEALWRSLDAGYATMKPEVHAEFVRDGLPMRELGRDTRRVIVSRR